MENLDERKKFEDVFRSDYGDLVRFVWGYVNDREAAKDIVHTVFLVLWRDREKLDFSRPLRPYLLTLCRNRSLDYLKHLRVVSENERDVGEYIRYEEDMEQYSRRLELVEEKLGQLGERQREVLVKCFVEGKKYKEIAGELGISVNSVKTHIVRGLSRLRENLSDEMLLFLIFLK